MERFFLAVEKKSSIGSDVNLEKNLKKFRLKWKNCGLFLFYRGKTVERFCLTIEKKILFVLTNI